MSSPTSSLSPVLDSEGLSAYLPPDIDEQLIFQLVTAAIAGMFIWDFVLDTYNVYRMFFKERPSLPSVVYVLSRISTLCFNVLSPRLMRGNCKRLFLAHAIAWVLASGLTSMLFLLRILALYRGRTMIIRFFTLLWLCVIGGAMTVCFVDPPVAHLLPNSSLCLFASAFPAYAGAGIICQAVFDMLAFFAISLWFLPWYEVDSHIEWREWTTLFFCGDGLPQLSKALLQGGQQYYLISVLASIVTLVFYFSPFIPLAYHSMASHILISLLNSMACKVYCDIKFGRAQASNSILPSSNIAFLPPNGSVARVPSPSFHAPQVAAPQEAVTTSTRAVAEIHPTTIGLVKLEVIVGGEHEHRHDYDGFEGYKKV